MDYKMFEDIPELRKNIDEAYKELNQATVDNEREKIDMLLPRISELSNKLNDRLKEVQEYMDSHDINEYKTRVDAAKSSLEEAKKQGDQESYDYAVANLEFAEKYLEDLEKIRALLPQEEEEVKESKVEENIDYGDMTTDLKEDLFALLLLQDLKKFKDDEINKIQKEADNKFATEENIENKNLQDNTLNKKLEVEYKRRDMINDMINDYIHSLSHVPQEQIDKLLEEIKNDKEYLNHKEENFSKAIDNFENNVYFDDNINTDLEENLINEIKEIESKYINNRNEINELLENENNQDIQNENTSIVNKTEETNTLEELDKKEANLNKERERLEELLEDESISDNDYEKFDRLLEETNAEITRTRRKIKDIEYDMETNQLDKLVKRYSKQSKEIEDRIHKLNEEAEMLKQEKNKLKEYKERIEEGQPIENNITKEDIELRNKEITERLDEIRRLKLTEEKTLNYKRDDLYEITGNKEYLDILTDIDKINYKASTNSIEHEEPTNISKLSLEPEVPTENHIEESVDQKPIINKEEKKKKINNLDEIKQKAAYYYNLKKHEVKEKLSEEPVDIGDITTDLKEDMIAFLNLQELKEIITDRIDNIHKDLDKVSIDTEEENLELKYIQLDELEGKLKVEYKIRDILNGILDDYKQSLSVVPSDKLNELLERIKNDKEYQENKDDNLRRMADNIDNNFDFNDKVNNNLEDQLTRDIQKAELKYLTNRNKSKEAQRLLLETESKAFEEFDKLIAIYKSISNKDIPTRYKENVDNKIKELTETQNNLNNKKEDSKPQDATSDDSFIDVEYSVERDEPQQELDSKEIAELERMSLKSEERIDELQERIKELEEKKRSYDELAKESCDEIIIKSQELKELIEKNASKEEKEENKESRTKSLAKLDFANSKIEEYQNLINQLNQEIEEEQSKLDNVTKQISSAREMNVNQNDNDINVNANIDNNNIISPTGNDSPNDQDTSNIGGDNSSTDQADDSNDSGSSDNSNDTGNDDSGNSDDSNDSGNDDSRSSDDTNDLGKDDSGSSDDSNDSKDDGSEDTDDSDDNDDFDEEYEPSAMDELKIPGIINKLVTDPETGEKIAVSKIDRIIVDSSKISIKQKFAKEFVTDAAIYGVFAYASCAIKAIPYVIDRAVSKLKLWLNPASKIKLEKVAKNYDEVLTEEEKEILLHKFKNNVANSDRSIEGILSVIREKNDKRIRETQIKKRSEKVVKIYNKLLTNYNEAQETQLMIDSLKNGDITVEEICEKLKIKKTDELTKEGLIEKLGEKRERILSTACKDISKFYKLNDKLRELYDGGVGVHSNTESIRAIESRVNQHKTVRFGKDRSTAEGVELREKVDKLGQVLDQAVAQNDNEAALKAFVGIQQENKKAEEVGMTFIRVLKGNLFPAGIPIIPVGKGHIGVGNFDPVAHEMDYRTDPFVRQVLTFAGTMVTLTAAVNNFMENYGLKRVADEQKALEDKLHTQGEQLSGYDQEVIEGMKAQDSLMITGDKNFHELNDTYWTDPGNYLVNDPAHHQELAELYSTTQSSYQEIADLLAAGKITPLEAAERHAEITSTLEDITHELFDSAKPGMEEYMRNHPQFDYTALQGALEEFEKHPNALTAENNALMEAIKIGEELASTSVATAKPHWLHDMIGVLGAVTLAHQANKTFGEVPTEEPVSLANLVDKSIEIDEKIVEVNKPKEKTNDIEDMLNEKDKDKSKEGKSPGKHQ